MKFRFINSLDQQKTFLIQIGDIDSLLWPTHSMEIINEMENERNIRIEFLIQMNNVICDTGNALVSGTTNIPSKLMTALHQQERNRTNAKLPNENIHLVLYKYYNYCNLSDSKKLSSHCTRNFIKKSFKRMKVN